MATANKEEVTIELLRTKSISTCIHQVKINPEKLVSSLEKLDRADFRPRFRNAKDPVFVAFKSLEKRSTKALLEDYVDDVFKQISKAISKKFN